MNRLSALLSWYDKNRRILPWREDPTPFHVWLSEIMLQQTRVPAARGYYERFLKTLPDVQALAEAKEDVYLKLWEGLGYYSRIRNMHKAAVEVMTTYNGQLPDEADALKALPGIGAYTAAAIAAVAYGKEAIALDGNLLRIFSRLTAYPENVNSTGAKKEAEAFFKQMLSEGDETKQERNVPGDFNQALMDLGATVCVPNTAPRCQLCPLRSSCLAHTYNAEENYPILPEKKARRIEEKTVLLIRYGAQIVLRQREKSGLLAGLYEYPNAEGHLSENEALDFAHSLGFDALRIRALPDAKHIFTHIEWRMKGYEITADEFDSQVRAQKKEITDPFLADVREVQEIYAIPAAFAAYTKQVTKISRRS